MTTHALRVAALTLLGASFANAQPQPTLGTAPTTVGEVRLKILGVAPRAADVPAVFSPDGKQLLYVQARQAARGPELVFVRWSATGKSPVDLLSPGVSKAAPLCFYADATQFSPDGKRVVLPVRERNAAGEDEAPQPVLVEANGDRTPIATTLPRAVGFGFAERALIVLEGRPDVRRGRRGYRLMAWTPRRYHAIESRAGKVACALRVSPDRKRVALLLRDGLRYQLRVIELSTRATVTSKRLHVDDVSFSGPVPIAWDARSAGIYFHATPGRKHPFQLTRFDLKTRRVEAVGAPDDVSLVAVLDADHLAVAGHRRGVPTAAILRRSDKALFALPRAGGFALLGGRGDRLVLERLDQRTRRRDLVVARFTLPGSKPSPPPSASR